MKYFVSFWVLISMLSSENIFCQTTISGNIPGGAHFHLRFTYFDDFISNKKVILTDTVLNPEGDFNIRIKDPEDHLGRWEMFPYYYKDFYLEAGKDYHLAFDTVHLHGVLRPFYQKQILPCTIQDTDYYIQKDLERIEAYYARFMEKNYQKIFFRHKSGLIDSLERKLADTITGKDNLTIRQTIAYKIALLKLTSANSRRKKEELFHHYIDKQDILYHSQAYMKFFKEFFKNYFTKNKYINFDDIGYVINRLESNAALQDTLGKDPLLRNERIRELVSLVNLKSLYKNPDFSKLAVLAILRQLHTGSKFAMHRRIAGNLLQSLPLLESGTKAPLMKVFSLDSVPIEIRFHNKDTIYYYVAFFISHNINCVRELQKIDSLSHTRNNKINFIGISLDEELETTRKLQEKFHFTFPVYWNGWNSKLIDDYKVETFPVFLSIDPAGNIIRYPEDMLNPILLEGKETEKN